MNGIAAIVLLGIGVGLLVLLIRYITFSFISKPGDSFWEYIKEEDMMRSKTAIERTRRNREKSIEDYRPRIECPFCAEKILPAAKICRYCKKELQK